MRIWLFVIGCILASCARVTSPTGGPPDKTPPKLVFSSPAHNSTGYKGKNIVLQFDEEIQLKNPKEEIIILPDIGTKTVYSVNKKTLIIKPEKFWDENTTYSFSFREAIQDLRASNPMSNFRFVFSTGDKIDSLQINGSVRSVFSMENLQNITVGVYESDTFNLFKHRPMYFSKTGKKGEFFLQNLKHGTFFLYAFDDKNKNLIVDSKSEKFGFLVEPINLVKDTTRNVLLYNVNTTKPKINSVRNADSVSMVNINKTVKKLFIQKRKSITPLIESSTNQVALFHPMMSDSITVKISAEDSLEQKIDTLVYIKSTNLKYPDSRFSLSVSTKNDAEKDELLLQVKCNKLIKSIRYDSCYYRIDTLKENHSISKEQLKSVDTIKQLYTFIVPYKREKVTTKKYNFFFGKGAFVSLKNDSSKQAKITTEILGEEKTGTLLIEVTSEKKNNILQLISSNKVIREYKNPKKLTLKNLEPATYRIRIIDDANGDGEWTPGIFWKKKSEEKVFLYQNEEGFEDIPIRANWEYGPVLIQF